MLPQQPLPVEALSPVLEIEESVQLAFYAHPDKTARKRHSLAPHPPQAKGLAKKRKKEGKKAKWSVRDGNIGGDWGSKQSRDFKLAKAFEKERKKSQKIAA